MIEVVPQKESKLIDNTSPITPTDKIVWNNYDNQHFYQTVAVEGLKELAEKGGLATGCDLALLKPYWSKANSILEVGAGYGRVINYLLEHGFSGEITAIERCDVFFDHLQKTFTNHANVKLMHEDIHKCEQVPEKFDLILFLWSGLADFSKDEQFYILQSLSNLLQKNGALIIDTFALEVMPLNSVQIAEQTYEFKIGNKVKYIYEPTSQEIYTYMKKIKLASYHRIACKSEIGRRRWLHMLS